MKIREIKESAEKAISRKDNWCIKSKDKKRAIAIATALGEGEHQLTRIRLAPVDACLMTLRLRFRTQPPTAENPKPESKEAIVNFPTTIELDVYGVEERAMLIAALEYALDKLKPTK